MDDGLDCYSLPLNQITPHVLYIGSILDSRNEPVLAARGIRAIVDLALGESPNMPAGEMVYLRYPLGSGSGNEPWLLRGALWSTAHLIRNRVPTLIHCQAGRNRSAAIAAGALSLATNKPPEECLTMVNSCREVDVASSMWKSVLSAVEGLR